MEFLKLTNDYRFKTELHAHTSPVSPCADFSPEDVMQIYAGAGVDSVTIVNHLTPDWMGRSADEYLEDYYKAKKAGEALGINAILGAEIRFTENHNDYLVFGISEADVGKMIEYLDRGIHTFFGEFKNEKNVIIQAHPFRNGIIQADPCDVDGYESFNLHPNHNSRIGPSAKLVAGTGRLSTCGTDFHHKGHEAMALLRTRERITDSFELARAIMSRDYLFDVWGHIVYPYGQ